MPTAGWPFIRRLIGVVFTVIAWSSWVSGTVGASMVEGLADVDPSERPGGLVAGLGEREHLLREVVSLLVEIPCFTSRRARIEKKISIWLGHEAWAGVS